MSRLIGWLNPWKNVPTAQSNVPTAKKVISRDESKIYVRKSIQLGKGKSKTASFIDVTVVCSAVTIKENQLWNFSLYNDENSAFNIELGALLIFKRIDVLYIN